MKPSKSLEEAQDFISGLGLPLPQKPETSDKRQQNGELELAWPSNVADLSPQELGEHLAWWSGWASFARVHLSKAEANVKSFKLELKTEYSIRLFKSRGDYEKVTELKASIISMPDIIRLEQKLMKAKARKLLLEALVAGYDSKYNTISREVTRKGLDFQQSRGDSLGDSRRYNRG